MLEECAAEQPTARSLVAQLGACEAAALAFCRLLERWARGDAQPSTAGGRQAALRHAADRVETALAGLEQPLDRYLLELEARARPRAARGTAAPAPAELLDWEPVLARAGVRAAPERVAQAYLELAVLVRALEGLTTAVRLDATPDRSRALGGPLRPAREPARPRRSTTCARSPRSDAGDACLLA